MPQPVPLSARIPRETLEPLRKKILLDKLLSDFLEAVPDLALVMSHERHVLAANSAFMAALGAGDMEQVIGKRPGEILRCLFCAEGADGCGTALHCSTCGALHSIISSQESNTRTVCETHVTLENGTALDLQVTSTPVSIDGLPLTLCIMKDISAEKRRSVLEKVFFHDVLNTVGSIRYVATVLANAKELPPGKEEEYRQWITDLSEKLADEISHQRKLLAAERGEFKPEMKLIRVSDLLTDVYRSYVNHDVAKDRHFVLGEIPACVIVSDYSTLRRILGNLVKNALEATDNEETVTIWCNESADTITFSVHNPGIIPQDVQLQLFQRSFSTKGGDGRGIGTYSVKLFGERFLKGKVSFVSREPEGTTFSLRLPKIMQEL